MTDWNQSQIRCFEIRWRLNVDDRCFPICPVLFHRTLRRLLFCYCTCLLGKAQHQRYWISWAGGGGASLASRRQDYNKNTAELVLGELGAFLCFILQSAHDLRRAFRSAVRTTKKMPLDMVLLQIVAVLLLPGAWGQSSSGGIGVVVEAKNITLPAGSRAVLPCHSPRMVWTQDRLKDRQRVVHWDVVRSSPEYSVERVLDMSPGGRQRVYNGFNKGRISIPDFGFNDGNFSLIINNVITTDRGVYTCNLHHHYCQIHQSIQIQLNVTKSARKEKRYWDGEKTVFVVLLGSSVVLPCVNRRPLWREGLQEDQQQVAHWDFQPPGVRPDRADRLVDLYASGERRDYGPLFAQSKMSVAEDAFTLGDFSLSISELKPVDKGLYSCHLHHHYCGLHERRIFRLTVGPPLPSAPTTAPRIVQNNEPEPRTDEVESPRVVNVILPEHRGYFVQHLGYFLATFLLLAFIVVAVIVLTRRRKKRGLEYELHRSERGNMISGGEMSLDCKELKTCNQGPVNSDYKNNLLKERDMTKDCNKDFDGKLWK